MTSTIKDVAAKAGVSPSTVSRVVTNHPRISEKTKRKVRLVMEELGYHPNVLARSLAKKSPESIGILIPSSTAEFFMNPFFPEVLRGISDMARTAGFDLLLSTSDSGKEDVSSLRRMIHGKRIDGVILLSSRMHDPLLEVVQESPFPVTLIGRPEQDESICWVNNDNIKACYEATEYVIKQGHERVGFIGGDPELLVTKDRIAGYTQALEAYGIPLDPKLILPSTFVEQGGYLAMMRLLALSDRPTAVVTADDVLAFGAIRAAGEFGYSLPEDLSIIGFNNIKLSEMSNPSLTSVNVYIYDLGWQAADLLFKQIQDPNFGFEHRIVPTELVVRNSCGPYTKQTGRG